MSQQLTRWRVVLVLLNGLGRPSYRALKDSDQRTIDILAWRFPLTLNGRLKLKRPRALLLAVFFP